MHMRDVQRNRLGSDALNDLLQILDGGSGINKNGLVRSFDQVNGFIGHHLAVSYPGMFVNLTENHIGTFVNDFLLVSRLESPTKALALSTTILR